MNKLRGIVSKKASKIAIILLNSKKEIAAALGITASASADEVVKHRRTIPNYK
jgi:hypothetical protein